MPGKGYQPLQPYPFQQEFLDCRHTYRAINKPRQCGISTIVAAEVAWEFDNVPGAQIMIVSKDLPAAQNFHTYVMDILHSVRLNNPDAPRLVKTNQSTTTNENGSRIVSLAATKEAGRSFSPTHFVFDEAAFTQYDEDIWQAASSGLAKTRGRATVISTPKGRTNFFYRIFEDPKHKGFTTFDYKWWHVPDYNPHYEKMMKAKTKHEEKKIIEEARKGEWYRAIRPSKSNLQWRQEFEGAFDANMGSVFSTRALEAVFERNYLEKKIDPKGILTEWWTRPKEDGHFYATGIDLGRKNDATVCITYDYTTRPATLVDFKYIEAGRAEWDMIEKVLTEHFLEWKPVSKHDGTGVGDSISEGMASHSEPFFFTKNTKQNKVELMQHAFDFRALRMPKIDILFREHQRYIWDDQDIAQDCVMANALAISNFHYTNDVVLGFTPLNFVGEAQPA